MTDADADDGLVRSSVYASRHRRRLHGPAPEKPALPVPKRRIHAFIIVADSTNTVTLLGSMPDKIVAAYRNLFRHSLRAVQFSKPARYIYRDRLREAFRDGDPADFDQSKIDNTVEFLKAATHDTGLEHKIVKNLCKVWWGQASRYQSCADPVPFIHRTKLNAFEHYDHNIRMLNESLGLCIPTTKHWQLLRWRQASEIVTPKSVQGKKSLLLKTHWEPYPELVMDTHGSTTFDH
ncbi:DUF1763-domain-containing protein [Pseudovirgaria hyperparasitica]|uniref:DUF1763-domain-containing protein n=1 Tax=Pseudovirgaria hyperparasitica TaxID=470096 RepID=A0A6A6VWJ1_9PEZI|nr:DUF1763-domain-containing protein [Pseudovirgaria hyperparasitica]KAF2754535.1 DUF1763-domain-containing protein [Pseudovirgaria hyperparasitica]